MTRDEAKQFILCDSEIMGGAPCIKGTRIPIQLIADMLDQGTTRQEILKGYPSLTPEHLQAAVVWVNPVK